MKNIVFILTVLLTSGSTSAQLFENKFTTKSIIITKNDTIICYLPYEDSFGSIVEYKLSKEDKNKEKKSVSIEEIVRIEKSYQIFEKLYYKGKPYLLKKLKDGQVKLYEYYFQRDPTYNKSGALISTGYDKTIYFIEKDNTLYKIRNSKKKKNLKAILTGNPEVTKMINDMNNSLYGYHLKRIIDKYNFWLKKNAN